MLNQSYKSYKNNALIRVIKNNFHKQQQQSSDFAAYHLCDSSVGEDVAGVDEAIEHLGRLLDQIALVGIVLQLFI